MKNFKVICFTSFRVSSHDLEIEKGRYKKVPAENRKRNVCESGGIENETHFIFDCALYDDERGLFLKTIE